VSPDPVVQLPTFSQSYNRYSYVLNNPLSYTDPSGFSLKKLFKKAKKAVKSVFKGIGKFIKQYAVDIAIGVIAIVRPELGKVLIRARAAQRTASAAMRRSRAGPDGGGGSPGVGPASTISSAFGLAPQHDSGLPQTSIDEIDERMAAALRVAIRMVRARSRSGEYGSRPIGVVILKDSRWYRREENDDYIVLRPAQPMDLEGRFMPHGGGMFGGGSIRDIRNRAAIVVQDRRHEVGYDRESLVRYWDWQSGQRFQCMWTLVIPL
jgi:hypothetical protein